MPELSPLAPASFPTLPPIAGVKMASLHCGIRYKTRKDLMLMAFDEGTTVAGVFTTSKTASAPVERCKLHTKGGYARGLLVNSGNSNAFTGAIGEQAVNQTLAATAKLLGCEAEELFVASTGVIGEPLPYERILEALPDIHSQLSENDWEGTAQAIMTTDTFPKAATRTAKIGAVDVTLNGIAKGSGMIAPDMATMLAFIATDAAIPAPTLQQMLSACTATTFNAITVDSDTSTSDTVLLFATGKAGNPAADYSEFKAALHSLMLDLALQIVKDGEGAQKFVTIEVSGADSDAAAKKVAMAIANSPLIKTAIAGEDPNWGRVVMAVGKSGERADRDLLKIWFGETLVAEKGMVNPDYREPVVAQYMKGREIFIRVDLGIGTGNFTAYTCDFTEGYIKINADYRS
jgi:glutamate N-acetyltransferase/amino-acid N-acetyltransferase